jgi:AAA domain
MCVQNASQAGEPSRHIICNGCHCTLQYTVIVYGNLWQPTNGSTTRLSLCCAIAKTTPKCHAGIGFLREWQRLNVAITRAKYAVWIVGHAETLATDPEWKNLIDFSKEKRFAQFDSIEIDVYPISNDFITTFQLFSGSACSGES